MTYRLRSLILLIWNLDMLCFSISEKVNHVLSLFDHWFLFFSLGPFSYFPHLFYLFLVLLLHRLAFPVLNFPFSFVQFTVLYVFHYFPLPSYPILHISSSHLPIIALPFLFFFFFPSLLSYFPSFPAPISYNVYIISHFIFNLNFHSFLSITVLFIFPYFSFTTFSSLFPFPHPLSLRM